MNAASTGKKWTTGEWITGVLIVAFALGIPLLVHLTREPLPPDELQPAQVLGKPLRLQTPAGERILVLSQQYGVHWFWGNGTGGRRWSSPASEQVIHLDLWAFAPGSATPLWRRRFTNNTPGVMTSAGDVLLGFGDRAWLELREPALVAAADGRVLANARPAGEAQRGGEVYDVRDLQARGARFGDRWIGVLTAANHAKLTGPDGGDARPDGQGFVGDDHDYQLWSARVREETGFFGKEQRYSGYLPLGERVSYHRAGLLMLAQRGEPVVLPGPESVLLLHRARDEAGGRLSLARIEVAGGAPLWSADALPIARLRHLLAGPQDLVLVGDAPRTANADGSMPDPEQWLVFLDLASGERSEFSLVRASLAAEPRPLD